MENGSKWEYIPRLSYSYSVAFALVWNCASGGKHLNAYTYGGNSECYQENVLTDNGYSDAWLQRTSDSFVYLCEKKNVL